MVARGNFFAVTLSFAANDRRERSSKLVEFGEAVIQRGDASASQSCSVIAVGQLSNATAFYQALSGLTSVFRRVLGC